MTEQPTEQDKSLVGKKKWYQEIGFWIGFVGWFGINGLTWLIFIAMGEAGIICSPVLMLVNIGALIYFAFKNRFLAFGLLCAFAINFIFLLVKGAALQAICFMPFFIDF